MRELIRKILQEGEDLDRIKRNEIEVPKTVPMIVKFIKEKYGKAVRVKVRDKGIHFGSDNYSATCKEINVYVEDETLTAAEVKVSIWNDIKNFFEIDLSSYGNCLGLQVYRKKWDKV